jgi:hypothetical protein
MPQISISCWRREMTPLVCAIALARSDDREALDRRPQQVDLVDRRALVVAGEPQHQRHDLGPRPDPRLIRSSALNTRPSRWSDAPSAD